MSFPVYVPQSGDQHKLGRVEEDTLDFFYEYNENIQKLLNDGIDIDPRIHECWNVLFEKNRSKLVEIPKNIKSFFSNKKIRKCNSKG